MRRFRGVLCASVALLVGLPSVALGHAERDAFFPTGEAATPVYRQSGPTLVVCKDDTAQRLVTLPPELRARNQALLQDCRFEHIQEAVDAVVEQGTRILVLPGIYREEPSIAARANPEGECAELATRQGEATSEEDEENEGIGGNVGGEEGVGAPVYSYEEQRACRHVQNLIGIFGDTDADGACDNALCRLQLEGTGATPTDVIIDGDFGHLNGIRIDRADGFYLRNLAVQRFEFNAVYALETDGFAFNDVLTRWNDEYGFLSFAVDHGLYENCEGYGNGDSAIYPGSASDLNQGRGIIDELESVRWATEIRGCRGHHSTLGYSGTAGNSVWTHHNEFDHNSTGIATDSLFPDHPGLPQDHALMEKNLIHSNNFNPYVRDVQAGKCTGEFKDRGYDDGVVCPVIPARVGTGILIAGGNANMIRDNVFYDNHEQNVWQFFVPAALRGENDPSKQFDTSNFNTTRDNESGRNPNGGMYQPTGLADFHWDGEGEGNCWTDNAAMAADGTMGSSSSAIGELPGAPLPGCDPRPPFTPGPAIAVHADCSNYSRDSNPNPPFCTWFDQPDVPEARQASAAGGPTLERVAGADRVVTAIAAGREGYPDRAETVVIARSDLFVDALVAGPLAAKLEGPLLVNPSGAGLAEVNRAEIARLGARRAIVIGGLAAQSRQVETDLAAAGVTDVVRINGTDRYDTAGQIADAVGGAHLFIARGDDPTDTTAVAYLAAKLGRPILPVPPSGLAPANVALLQRGLFTDAKIVGGEAAVPAAVETQLGQFVEDLARLAGDTRYATSLAVAQYALDTGSDPTELWLTTGRNWVDGIGASSSIAVDEGILLLSDGDADEASLATWLDAQQPILERIRVLGGPAALPDSLMAQLRDDRGAVDGDAVGDRSGGNQVTTGTFAPFADAPATYQDVTGFLRLTRTITGTTRAELLVEGVPANTFHPVHLHVNTCSVDKAGPHFQFEIGGPMMPPNEIHPRFTSDAVGVGVADVTVFELADESARSAVLHTPEGVKVACVDLR